MTKEMRDGVIVALDALSNWRHEVETANKRCLGKVLDRTSSCTNPQLPSNASSPTPSSVPSCSKPSKDKPLAGWRYALCPCSVADGRECLSVSGEIRHAAAAWIRRTQALLALASPTF